MPDVGVAPPVEAERGQERGRKETATPSPLMEEFGILVPPSTTYGDLLMDLYNNPVGNNLADNRCDSEETCRRAASNGGLITGWKGKGLTVTPVPPHGPYYPEYFDR